VEEIDWAYGHV